MIKKRFGAKKRAILVTPFLSNFIKDDYNILSEEYNVYVNTYNWKKKYFSPLYLAFQTVYLIRNIWSTSFIIIEFGGYWSLLPAVMGVIFRVPVFIVLHGTDCAFLPSINYGSLRKKPLRLFCRLSYKLATILLPVSRSLVITKNTYYKEERYKYQGYKYFFPKIETPFKIISNGVDSNFWKRQKEIVKEKKSFIAVFSEEQIVLKGGDLIIKQAKAFIDCNFYIVGLNAPPNNFEIPKNVFFLGRLGKEKLRDYYSKCQFHFQLSMFEGFGLALCEAMLCECIPIGSAVNMIPEIIGDSGFILEKKNDKLLSNVINNALLVKNKDELGKRARSRIVERYNKEKRQSELLSQIKNYIK